MPTQNIIFNFRPDVANHIWRSFSAPFKKFLDGWEITSSGANINPENSDKFKHDLLKLMNDHKRVPDEILDSSNSDKWGEVISIRYYFYNVPNNRIPRFITQFKKQFDIYYRQDLLTEHPVSEEWECEWVIGQRTQYDFPSDHHPDKFCWKPEEVCRINTTDRSVFPPSITISRAPSLGYDAYPFVKNDSDEDCSLCDNTITGFGNNAQPLSIDRCCDTCNTTKVIPARMEKVSWVRKNKEMIDFTIDRSDEPDTEPESDSESDELEKDKQTEETIKGFRIFTQMLENAYEDKQTNENKVIDFYDKCMVNGLNPEYWDEDTQEYLYPDCADYAINKYISDNDIKDWLDFKTQFVKDRIGESC